MRKEITDLFSECFAEKCFGEKQVFDAKLLGRDRQQLNKDSVQGQEDDVDQGHDYRTQYESRQQSGQLPSPTALLRGPAALQAAATDATTERCLNRSVLCTAAASAAAERTQPVWKVVKVLLVVADVERRRRTRNRTVWWAADHVRTLLSSPIVFRAQDNAAVSYSVPHHFTAAWHSFHDQLSISVPTAAAAAETSATMQDNE